MNLSIVRTLTLSLSTVLVPVSLMAQGPIHVTIPFDFNVGSKSFSEGEYRVEASSPFLAVRSADGRSSVMALANNADSTAKPGMGELTFHRYGDRYFLSLVSQDRRGWELPTSAIEKEVIAKKTSAELVRLSAATSK